MLQVLSLHSTTHTEENHEKLLLVYPIVPKSTPRYKSRAFPLGEPRNVGLFYALFTLKYSFVLISSGGRQSDIGHQFLWLPSFPVLRSRDDHSYKSAS
jgi:hypothetical protein